MNRAGRIVPRGMGGFLNPPSHPEHHYHVEGDLDRRQQDRGGYSLTAALASTLDEATKLAARRMLDAWVPPPIDSPETVEWIHRVLGYFGPGYRNPDAPEGGQWFASALIFDKGRDPLEHVADHAGVRFIRKFYPAYELTRADLAAAYWGTKGGTP